jgi:hypothetical protein
MQTNGCGSMAGIIFFISYFLMVPLIFLNLFIAIILEGFEQTNQRVNNLIPEEELEKFRDHWSTYDRDATGYIKIKDLTKLMFDLRDPLGWNERYREDLEW